MTESVGTGESKHIGYLPTGGPSIVRFLSIIRNYPNLIHPREKFFLLVMIPVPEAAYDELRIERPNVVKVDGSLVVIPGIDLGVQATGIPKGETFACWAETIMQSLEGDLADHVGEILISHLQQKMLWGRKYGFLHAPFTCFGEPVPDQVFQQPVRVHIGV